MATTKTTEKELACLEAIVGSEFQNADGEGTIDHMVWTYSLFSIPERSHGGLLKSLRDKGYVRLDSDEEFGDMCAITRAGYDALVEAKKEVRA